MHVFLYLFLLSDKKGDVQKKGLDRRSHHIRIPDFGSLFSAIFEFSDAKLV